MKKIPLSRSFAKGLTSYLRQACLSLDRAEGHEDLHQYYERADIVEPAIVVSALAPVQADRLDYDRAFRRAHSFLFAAKHLFSPTLEWRIAGQIAIPLGEWAFIRGGLIALAELVDSPDIWGMDLRNRVRLHLEIASILIGKRLPIGVRSQAYQVEHLNQSPHLLLRSIDEICGDRWLLGNPNRRQP